MSSQPSQEGQSGQNPPSGPPYPIPAAQLGGTPTTTVDVPICAVLITIFLSLAIFNAVRWRRNKARGHNFIISLIIVAFCVSRIYANSLRIALAVDPKNVRLNIAANIFFNAGVLIFFIINLIFMQRLWRARHPSIGWSRLMGWGFKFLYFGIFACFAMVLTAVVYGAYTLDQDVQLSLRDIRRTSAVYMAILAFIPLPGTILCVILPSRKPIEDFGSGSMRTKIFLVLFTTTLLSLGAGFRASIGFLQRPIDDPGWFNHKAPYYCFNYLIEIIVACTYTFSRFDQRFWIPDACKKAGDYARVSKVEGSDMSVHDDDVALRENRPVAKDERAQEEAWETSLHHELSMKYVA